MGSPVIISEKELRCLLRTLINEYVANDTPKNANKATHPDPSASAWDSGLDEAEEDHCDDHGSEEKHDGRWKDHADPTGSSWNSGLE